MPEQRGHGQAEIGVLEFLLPGASATLESRADVPAPPVEFDGRASGVLNGNVSQVTGKARREVGAWPTAEGVVDQLVAALAEAADAETEPERTSRLREAAETLGSTGYRIAVDVATKWAEHKAGV